MAHTGRYFGNSASRKPKVISSLINWAAAKTLIGNRRSQTRVTKYITDIAEKFPGNNLSTVKQIAQFVYGQTPVRQTIHKDRYSKDATQILKRGSTDLLHCTDRCHALVSILTAKKIPSWLAVEYDLNKFIHVYVEAVFDNSLHTIAFKEKDPPFVAEGRAEDTIKGAKGSTFVRAHDLNQLGVVSERTYEAFVRRMEEGKAKTRITFPRG